MNRYSGKVESRSKTVWDVMANQDGHNRIVALLWCVFAGGLVTAAIGYTDQSMSAVYTTAPPLAFSVITYVCILLYATRLARKSRRQAQKIHQ